MSNTRVGNAGTCEISMKFTKTFSQTLWRALSQTLRNSFNNQQSYHQQCGIYFRNPSPGFLTKGCTFYQNKLVQYISFFLWEFYHLLIDLNKNQKHCGKGARSTLSQKSIASYPSVYSLRKPKLFHALHFFSFIKINLTASLQGLS